MTLFKQWTELMESQTEETFEAFWEEYSGAETKIYQHILANKDTHLAGTVKELAEKVNDALPIDITVKEIYVLVVLVIRNFYASVN